ncbi:hypothetical protein HZP84_16115 [Elizabethkingia anophelis]|nr:hypothetical protein [Elizabethkingia anophelis]MCT3824959.1 hypothetical protein [Elizabethkingia anophelis]MCT3932264.1 hypothetical protein [Elizabethkingia anophelis]MCT4078330.1 hypothetical protein [Elizabethkingia anophelis]MCT4081655.1 hypothetical protein [Elizabethkingia anophelis]
MEENNTLVKYEYGAMSSKYSLLAKSKLTAYAAMCAHFKSSAHLIAIYKPVECKEDSWLNPMGQISERLDDVFGGKDTFDKYFEDNIEAIKEAYKSIKKII